MSIIFFPREFIICFKSVQAKQVDLEMFAARSVAARPNTLKLASLTLKNLRAVDLQQVLIFTCAWLLLRKKKEYS